MAEASAPNPRCATACHQRITCEASRTQAEASEARTESGPWTKSSRSASARASDLSNVSNGDLGQVLSHLSPAVETKPSKASGPHQAVCTCRSSACCRGDAKSELLILMI